MRSRSLLLVSSFTWIGFVTFPARAVAPPLPTVHASRSDPAELRRRGSRQGQRRRSGDMRSIRARPQASLVLGTMKQAGPVGFRARWNPRAAADPAAARAVTDDDMAGDSTTTIPSSACGRSTGERRFGGGDRLRSRSAAHLRHRSGCAPRPGCGAARRRHCAPDAPFVFSRGKAEVNERSDRLRPGHDPRRRRRGARSPSSASAIAPASPASPCGRTATAPSPIACSVVSRCPIASPCRTTPPGRRASPATTRRRRWRVWSSTSARRSSTSRRRRSASGGCRCGARSPRPKLIYCVREFGVPYDCVWDPGEEEYACALRWDRDPGRWAAPVGRRRRAHHLRRRAGPRLSVGVEPGRQHLRRLRARRRQSLSRRLRRRRRRATDGAEHCDGSAVVGAALGPAFPHGLLVVHDGENRPTSPGPTASCARTPTSSTSRGSASRASCPLSQGERALRGRRRGCGKGATLAAWLAYDWCHE